MVQAGPRCQLGFVTGLGLLQEHGRSGVVVEAGHEGRCGVSKCASGGQHKELCSEKYCCAEVWHESLLGAEA
eukprot:11172459-Lingulodinium_polyedra.AAC.1